MQSDYERANSPEDGEYHFSDEGVYDASGEETAVPEVRENSGLSARFASYRRFIILGGIFAGVLLVVYLLITPPTVPSAPEMTTAIKPPVAPVNKIASGPSAQKAFAPGVAIKPELKGDVAAVKTMPMAAAPALSQKPVAAMPATDLTAMVAASKPLTEQPAQPVSSPVLTDRTVMERLTVLEETNTKMIGQLNADYAHRLAEFETQDKALQEQVRTLAIKISSMEAQLNQLVQTLNKQPAAPASANNDNNNTSTASNANSNSPIIIPGSEPLPTPALKTSYSVQAIIPGRAWLRTENGETVTVAEGDMLKGLGRVTKIDPYDGTIQIDTGNKTIMLTYGNGDYA